VAAALERAGNEISESRLTNLWGQQGKITVLMVNAREAAYLSRSPQELWADRSK
jgi:hypothetical protein